MAATTSSRARKPVLDAIHDIQPYIEYQRCNGCGWTLAERLNGDLYCPHLTCDFSGRAVGQAEHQALM